MIMILSTLLLLLRELDLGYIELSCLLIQFVHVCVYFRSLDYHENETGCDITCDRTVCTCDGTRIDEPFSFVLVHLVLVCMSCDENIHIHLSLKSRQRLGTSPWNHLMSVTKTNLELSNLYNFLFGKTFNLLLLMGILVHEW